MFHKTIHKTWYIFKYSKQSPKIFAENHVLRLSINWKFLSIDRVLFLIEEQKLNCDWFIQRLQDYFLAISIDRAKVSTNWKCWISNFYLENSRTWIFTLTTLWNYILQTQTSLLQHIHVYTYIYISNNIIPWFLSLYGGRERRPQSIIYCNSSKKWHFIRRTKKMPTF